MSELIRDRRWLFALVAATVAALSGLFLVGVAAWFLAAAALVSASAVATTFSATASAVLIRLLAALRIGGKYTERVVGHAAALEDQTAHRAALFRRIARDPEAARSGWQLARADRLQHFLGDVEAVDFKRLRVVLPGVALCVCGFAVLLVTVAAVPRALFPLTVISSALTAGAFVLSGRAARKQKRAATLRMLTGERLGLELSSLEALQAEGRRRSTFTDTISGVADAEGLERGARSDLQVADAFLGAAGPVGALVVLVTGALDGMIGAAALPVLLTSFVWLAFGEVVTPFARMRFAALEGARAGEALATYKASPPDKSMTESRSFALQDESLFDPDGQALRGSVSLSAAPGQPVALYGPSGCGKTSLLKRLAGWLPWQSGEHPLGSEGAARTATHLSLHDAAILDGTLRDNLFTDAPDAEIIEVLEEMELADRVESLGGLGARVRQDTLSLGEARRIALARAALAPQPFILLDEPGEHLDGTQGERVLRRLLHRLNDRTVVFVTHDKRLASLGAEVVHLS